MLFDVTLFGRINWTTYGLRTIKVQEAIDIIRVGAYPICDGCTLRNITEYIQHQPISADIQSLKAQYLPAVSFNGVYSNGIVKYSNVTALDFDHIATQEEFTYLYQRLRATPCVGWIYRTPSGRGLKALILHDNADSNLHENLYQQLMQKFQTPYTKADASCRDLSRRNYLCYDPDVWSNLSPIPFHFEYDAAFDLSPPASTIAHTQITQLVVKSQIAQCLPSDASIMNMLKSRCKRFHPDYLFEGARRDGVYWFGTQASKAGVNFDYGLEYVKNLYQSNEITLTRGGAFTDDEIRDNYTNGYGTETYNDEYRRSFIIKKI